MANFIKNTLINTQKTYVNKFSTRLENLLAMGEERYLSWTFESRESFQGFKPWKKTKIAKWVQKSIYRLLDAVIVIGGSFVDIIYKHPYLEMRLKTGAILWRTGSQTYILVGTIYLHNSGRLTFWSKDGREMSMYEAYLPSAELKRERRVEGNNPEIKALRNKLRRLKGRPPLV